jgi:hypothetical protein
MLLENIIDGKRDVNTNDTVPELNESIYYGSFYCAYREDGTVFVWIPRWIRTDVMVYDDAIKSVIRTSLESAPLTDRKIVANMRISHCRDIGMPDDQDLACVSYSVTNEYVSSGSESYGILSIKTAMRDTTQKIIEYINGVSK